MRIDQHTLFFLDASCLFAATISESGGSAFLFWLGQKKFLRLSTSHPALLEAERNIAIKFGFDHLRTYYELLENTPLIIAPLQLQEPNMHTKVMHVNKEDRHILLAALAIHAPFLVTLDKKLLREINEQTLPMLAITPRECIVSILPSHPAYAKLKN